jgi:hypothetical protein
MALNLDDFIVDGPQSAAPAFNLDDYIVDGGPQTANLVSDSGRWVVEDGDTIINKASGEVFRLDGMNTPETVHQEKGWRSNEYGATDATRRTLDFINRAEANGELKLETHGQDSYGRTLARIPGHVEEMIRSGNAVVESRTQDPNINRARLERMLSDEPLPAIPPDAARAAGQRLDENLRARAHARPTERISGTGTFGRAFERGVDQTKGLAGAGLEVLGQLTGWEGGEKMGREIADAAEREQRANPAEVPTWEDVHSIGDFGTYALEKVGEQVANLALMAAGGGVGGAVAKRGVAAAVEGLGVREAATLAARRAAAGRMTGMTASNMPVSVGEVQQELHEGGIRAPGTALLGGTVISGMDALGLEAVLGRFFDPAKRVVAKNFAEALAKEVPKAMGFGALAEAPTEYAQEIVAVAARAMHDPTYEIFSEENLKRFREAAFAGGIVGGALGGAGGAVKSIGYERPAGAPSPDGAQPPAGTPPPAGDAAPSTMPDGRPVPPPADGPEVDQPRSTRPWYDALPDDFEVELPITVAETGEQGTARMPAKQAASELSAQREAYELLRECLTR